MRKKIFGYLVVAVVVAVFAVSCGDDEPNGGKEPGGGDDGITRVKDGNGKVFLESGVLVDANLNYTGAELERALTQYEWEREYSFYYDRAKISSREEIGGLPICVYPNYTMDFGFGGYWRIRDISVSGKVLTATMREDYIGGTYYPPMQFTVVALDFYGESGRMVIDAKLSTEVEGYDNDTLYARMVWWTVASETAGE